MQAAQQADRRGQAVEQVASRPHLRQQRRVAQPLRQPRQPVAVDAQRLQRAQPAQPLGQGGEAAVRGAERAEAGKVAERVGERLQLRARELELQEGREGACSRGGGEEWTARPPLLDQERERVARPPPPAGR